MNLSKFNEKLWEIEDSIRTKESEGAFDEHSSSRPGSASPMMSAPQSSTGLI